MPALRAPEFEPLFSQAAFQYGVKQNIQFERMAGNHP
jgi:hypothetical protein